MTYESNKNWIFPEKIPSDFKEIYKDYTPIQAQLLFNREKKNKKDIEDFFYTSLTRLPHYTSMSDIKSVIDLIVLSVKENKKIFIHGDFDVDGVCATAIIWEFLYKYLSEKINKKIDVVPYIPDRVDEGYGLSENSVQAMINQGAELIITVDCGVRDYEIINKYREQGKLEFIITDHHQPPEDIFEKADYPILHPMYKGKEFLETNVCGSFVIFYLVLGLAESFGIDQNLIIEKYIDLVALPTVTDMMPITGLNRVVVKNGLDYMRKGNRIGLKELFNVAGVDIKNADTYHLGYVIGPRINAAGRIESAMDPLRLLVTDSTNFAQNIARKLNEINLRRQNLTEKVLSDAKSELKKKMIKENVLVALGNEWPEGIVGLVAGKILEEFNKPTLIITNNNGEIRGSARSITGFNITEEIEKYSDLLVKYGGHSQAAGFTIKNGKEEEFITKFIKSSNEILKGKKLIKELYIDAIINTDLLTIDLVDEINKFSPFGYGNKRPLICLQNLVLVEKKLLEAKETI